MIKLKRSTIAVIFLLFAVGLSACLKQKPDSPPDTTKQNPDLKATTSIRELKSMQQGVALPQKIIIAGVVVFSDKSGNYFKKIVIQDSTGGIEIALNRTYLYADFPVGRMIFVPCGGLFLSEKNGMKQLGGAPDANGYASPIPAPEIKNYLFPGKYPVMIQPETLSVYQLAVPENAKHFLNTLVVVKDVEFVDSNTAIPFALPSDIAASTTRILQDCSGATLSLRTSGYANFQAIRTPAGKGTITALYTRFDEHPQLGIRDTADIWFHAPRCNQLPPSGSILTLLQFRQLYSGSSGHILLGNVKITGIVISDKNYKNTAPYSFILQGGAEDAGILVQLNQEHNLSIGDSIIIQTNGATLENHYGTLALKNLSNDAIQVKGHNKHLPAQTVTVAQLMANPQSFDSRLVKIKNIHWLLFPSTFNGQSGNLLFSDSTGSMNHFCEQAATFRNEMVPQQTATSITGYIFIRNQQPFLKMRHPNAPENDLKN